VSAARAASVALSVVLAVRLAPVGSAGAAVIYSYEAQPQRTSAGPHRVAKPHALSGPPLGSTAPQGEGENTAGVPSAEGDQLVENGLSSPLCKGSMSGGLSRAAQSNCQTSGFVGAPAPTNNYAIDVNIDVGALGLSKGGLLSVIQDVFIAPVWNAVVWVVHALVVMLEWCYTLELLGGSTMSGVARALRQAQASFTEPWLTLVLAVASILAFYNGLIRRRVAETLGQALMTIAMMVAGLWVIADPVGTVGAVGQWANQASLGTLGAIAQGTPANAPRTLADSMRAVFGGAIEMPWCYLEFGNVRWCSDPALLDPRLHKAALRIAASQQGKLGCRPSFARPLCAPPGNASALTIEHSDELLGEADTNGKLFLAFPANGPGRNSVKEASSLLHVLCQTEDDTKCTGSTAAQAEFRSDSGTFPRMIGVVLIAAGVLGMVMLFGLIALRLLAAAIVSLFMLLLAPFAVLAPALGDGGRSVFGGWLTRLLGAVTSKLIFSFLLGALLTMQRILMSLQLLGWWTQWLLISAFWWAVFLKRHQAVAFVQNRGREPVGRERRPVGRRLESALQTPRAMLHPVRWAKGKVLSPVPATEQLHKRGHGDRDSNSKRADEQKGRTPEHTTVPRAREQSRLHTRTLAKRAQLERVSAAREAALAHGDRRRAAKLAVREQRIEAELAHDRERFDGARPNGAETASARNPTGPTRARERRAGQLDRQTAPSTNSDRQGDKRPRDDAGVASRAGDGRDRHGPPEPRAGREAHGRTGRELPLPTAAKEAARANAPVLAYAEQRKKDRELDPERERRKHTESLSKRSAPDSNPRVSGRRDPAGAGGGSPTGLGDAPMGARERKSPVMDDARAVAERRKRQLGYEPNP
jgi:hypothetical protein